MNNLESGIGEEAALSELDQYLRRNRLRQQSGRNFAFYPVDPYEYTAEMREYISTHYGHDMFSDFCYEGTAEYVDRGIQWMSQEMFSCDSERRGGLVLPSCTEAIHHCFLRGLTRYYEARGHDFEAEGHPNERPVILAPREARFLVERVAIACGLGSNSCRYYDGEIPEPIPNNVAVNFMLGGDTQTGMAQDIAGIIDAVGSEPFHIVDAAPHGFNFWAQGRNEEIDFSNPIDALIVNPQKAGGTSGGTLLFLRDLAVEEERLRVQARASWLVSRDASSACAFFATLRARGPEWFRDERLRAIELRNYFRSLMETRADLFTLIESDNTVVTFTANNERTRYLAEQINNGEDKIPGEFITYAEDDDVLWAVTSPRHTRELIDEFFERICEAL